MYYADTYLRSGMRVIYLPAYSPDFNPIELAFSAIKSDLKRDGYKVRLAMSEGDFFTAYLTLHERVFRVTEDDVRAWFTKCGYMEPARFGAYL